MTAAADPEAEDRLPDGRRGQVVIAGLIIAIGLGLMAHPLYLWPHYGQTSVGMYAEAMSEPPETFVEFEQLPPEARTAFREELTTGETVLWTGDDDRAIEALDGAVVHYQGEYYRVILTFGHNVDFIPALLRWMLTAASAFMVVYGGLVLYARTWRPLTPVRSLWAPVVVAAGFLATAWYDVSFSGVSGPVLRITGDVAGLDLLQIIPISSLFLAIGSQSALHGWRSRLTLGGTLGILLLVFARFGTVHPVALIALTVYTAIGGAPWIALGYRLTRAN